MLNKILKNQTFSIQVVSLTFVTCTHTPSLLIRLIITEDGIWIMGAMFPKIMKLLSEDESDEGNSMVLVLSKFSSVAICALITSNRNDTCIAKQSSKIILAYCTQIHFVWIYDFQNYHQMCTHCMQVQSSVKKIHHVLRSLIIKFFQYKSKKYSLKYTNALCIVTFI